MLEDQASKQGTQTCDALIDTYCKLFFNPSKQKTHSSIRVKSNEVLNLFLGPNHPCFQLKNNNWGVAYYFYISFAYD